MREWVVKTAPLPPGIHALPDGSYTAMRMVLCALSIVGSEHWHGAFGNRPLSFVLGDGAMLCRASPKPDGGAAMTGSDAVVKLTGDGPQAYSPLMHGALSNIHHVDPLCCAAVQAAEMMSCPTRQSADEYASVIHQHEAALYQSAKTFAEINNEGLINALAQLTGPGSSPP
jgi:hypothetical protein